MTVKEQIDDIFACEVRIVRLLAECATPDEKDMLLRSAERLEGIWKMRDEYESTK